MPGRRILWRNLDEPGAERAILHETPEAISLSGTVIIGLSGPTEVRYQIECDSEWRTRSVRVEIEHEQGARSLDLQADGDGGWLRDGAPLDIGPGCIDVDLGVSPVTNTLPIRRLGLAVGESRAVNVAWVLFPSLTVQRSRQVYERLEPNVYRFSDDGFSADLVVDDAGLVVTYPGGWQREAVAAL